MLFNKVVFINSQISHHENEFIESHIQILHYLKTSILRKRFAYYELIVFKLPWSEVLSKN